MCQRAYVNANVTYITSAWGGSMGGERMGDVICHTFAKNGRIKLIRKGTVHINAENMM